MGHFPNNILESLKETVVNVFWKKTDVKVLFRRAEVPESILNEQNWDGYKYHFVSPVLDYLNKTKIGIGPLRRILQETLNYKDGDHLLWLSDGKKRKREAERCLEHLRLLVKDHNAIKKTEEEERKERLKRLEESKKGLAFKNKLEEIKEKFYQFVQNPDAQERGYGLEKILYQLFLLFELNPKGPFKRVGEQIDGAFTCERDHFLLEAKWQKAPIILSDLRDLDGAVASSLDNTLGLFISINGFSKEALDGYSQGSRPKLICMDGSDLIAILELRIDLNDLIFRKMEIAVQKRKIFIPVTKILEGNE